MNIFQQQYIEKKWPRMLKYLPLKVLEYSILSYRIETQNITFYSNGKMGSNSMKMYHHMLHLLMILNISTNAVEFCLNLLVPNKDY